MNRVVRTYFEDLGGMIVLAVDGTRRVLGRPWGVGLWIEQMYQLGVRSLTLANLTLLFTGMVLAVQTGYSLSAYGGQAFVGDIVALSVVRELGPVLTALMVAGRVGAGITAELGSMVVTEQVDALRALGADPIKKLVVPRIGALIIALPCLTVFAITSALFGALIMAIVDVGQGREYFLDHVFRALTVDDVVSGVGKSVFFAWFIGLIACYNGLTVQGGADGVGKATTETVVTSCLAVIISDFFLTKLFLVLP